MVTHRTSISPPGSVRESLEQIVRAYRHLAEEHRREGLHGSWRRRFERQLADLERRLERLLERHVHDDEERRAWRGRLVGAMPLPAPVATRGPLRFAGLSPTGSRLEVREGAGGLGVWRDGVLVERISPEAELETIGGVVRYQGTEFDEIFQAPEDAVEALVEYASGARTAAPWRCAEDLIDDGLVDRHFALTPRGRRIVARRRAS